VTLNKFFFISATNEELTSPVDKLSIPSTHRPSHLSTTPLTPAGNIVDMQGAIHHGTPLPSDEAGQTGEEENSPMTATDQLETNQIVENEEISLASAETERNSSINGNEDTQSSSCVVINVDTENSACEYGDGDGSSVLSSKTCSVEDVCLAGVQEEMKSVSLTEHCVGKVMSEMKSEAVLEDVKQEPRSAQTEENVCVSVEVQELSSESPSVSVEEEEDEEAAAPSLKQAESPEYINPRGVRFMSQEVGQDGE
jgi:hypothetical protein